MVVHSRVIALYLLSNTGSTSIVSEYFVLLTLYEKEQKDFMRELFITIHILLFIPIFCKYEISIQCYLHKVPLGVNCALYLGQLLLIIAKLLKERFTQRILNNYRGPGLLAVV
jgi:hypothetical protein